MLPLWENYDIEPSNFEHISKAFSTLSLFIIIVIKKWPGNWTVALNVVMPASGRAKEGYFRHLVGLLRVDGAYKGTVLYPLLTATRLKLTEQRTSEANY